MQSKVDNSYLRAQTRASGSRASSAYAPDRRNQTVAGSKRQRYFELRLFVAYCVIFYFVPYVLIQFVGNPLERSFFPRPSYTAGVAYAFFAILVFWLMQSLNQPAFKPMSLKYSRFLYGSRTSFGLAMIFLSLSIWSALYLGAAFRQTGEALSDVGIVGFALVFMKIVMGTSVVVHYRMVKENRDRVWRTSILFVIAMSFTINIQASPDVVFAFAALVAATYSIRKSLGIYGKWLQNLSVILLPAMVLLVFYLGTANKIGWDAAAARILNPSILLIEFLRRYSYHIYSLSVHVEQSMFDFELAFKAIKEVASVMWFRFGSIFGLSVERPELGSIARMNFFYLANFDKDRVGASPGMLGSIFFLPAAGLAIFYAVIFIRWVFSLLYHIMGRVMDNWLFIILSVFLVATSLDAMLDTLNPLSNGFVRLICLYLGASYVVARLASGVEHSNDTRRRGASRSI